MSFSVNYIGEAEAIKAALRAESVRMGEHSYNEQSKAEFDAVLPALETILDQQVGNGVIHLHASGHATFQDGKKTYGNCIVEAKPLGSILLK